MKFVVAALAVLALAGCAATPAPAPTGTYDIAVTRPLPADGSFDYQLGGGYAPAEGTTIVARDRTDEPAEGLYTICYVNGFQSQGEDADLWAENDDLILHDAAGEPVIDVNWPDEYLFDTSTAEKREGLAAIIGEWIDGCAADGFQAVEFDNLDSFSRSDGALTEDDNVALATLLVSRAQQAGLEAGQKNSAEFGARGPEIGFSFAVAEECHRWDECALYTDVYGDAVLDIEYTDDLRGTAEEVCADPQLPSRTIIRDRDLTQPDNAAYFFEAC